jgi:hypothetical protein
MQRTLPADRHSRMPFAVNALRFVLAVMALTVVPSASHAQHYLSLSGGPAIAMGGIAGDRPIGTLLALSLERERLEPGRAWRAELVAGGFKAPKGFEDAMGPLRHVAMLGHVVYVMPHPEIEPYATAGIGPAWRELGSPSRESAWGVLGAVTAGIRTGRIDKRVFIEARLQSSLAGEVASGRRLQNWGVVLLGVSLGGD